MKAKKILLRLVISLGIINAIFCVIFFFLGAMSLVAMEATDANSIISDYFTSGVFVPLWVATLVAKFSKEAKAFKEDFVDWTTKNIFRVSE
jgi:hypothetical protein